MQTPTLNLSVRLPVDEAEAFRREAESRGLSVNRALRLLIAERHGSL